MSPSATDLFSRKGPVSTVRTDEISLLLQSPANGQPNAAQPDAAPPTEPHNLQSESIPEENMAQEKTIDSQRSASQESAAVNPPKPRVDLTGIFRKIQLENLADAPSAARATSAQSEGSEQSSQALHQDLSAKNTVGGSQVGFTQMFQSLSATAASTNPPAASGKAATDKTSSDELLGFATWNENPPSRGEIAGDPYSPSSSPSSPKGNFTSLFQSLGKESATTSDYEKLSPSSPAPQSKGGFTQLLRTLSAEAETEAPAYPVAPPPAPPQPSSGPGEFTRVISGSMLREAQGRAGAPLQAASPHLPAAAQNNTPSAPAINLPASMPAVPHSPQQLLSPQPMPMQQFPLHASSLPAQPVSTPPVQNQAPQNPLPQLQTPASKLQQYMPLLLIANLFLMLLVLTLVVVVLLARH